MAVAEIIKEIIADKGISYVRISQKTGYSVDMISKSLNGKRKLSADEMIGICSASDIDLSDIRDTA